MEPRDVHLFWHAAHDNDPANRWLRENLAATFQEQQCKTPSNSSIYSRFKYLI